MGSATSHNFDFRPLQLDELTVGLLLKLDEVQARLLTDPPRQWDQFIDEYRGRKSLDRVLKDLRVVGLLSDIIADTAEQVTKHQKRFWTVDDFNNYHLTSPKLLRQVLEETKKRILDNPYCITQVTLARARRAAWRFHPMRTALGIVRSTLRRESATRPSPTKGF